MTDSPPPESGRPERTPGPGRRTAWSSIEHGLLETLLPGLIGYRGLIVGPLTAPELADIQSGTLCRWHIGRADTPGADIVYDGSRLPVASGSIDVLVLSHALEESPDPHRLVRECARVLSHRGQWLTLVHNPIAPVALGRMLWRSRLGLRPTPAVPRAARLIDWLRLIEFQTTDAWRYGPTLTQVTRRGVVAADTPWMLPVGWLAGGYALLARRRALRRIPPGRRARIVAPRSAWARLPHERNRHEDNG